jgi:transposase
MAGSFWLSDAQWDRLRPLLSNKPRGVRGWNDRLVISGMVVALQSGGRWIDVPAAYGPRKTLYNRFVRWSTRVSGARSSRLWLRPRPFGGGPARQHSCEGAPLRDRWKRGSRAQALGISRGGRTTKIHSLSDGEGRPLAFVLTGGQAADCRAAEALLQRLAPSTLVMADRAYDTNAVRQQIEQQGCGAEHPAQAHEALQALL